MTRDWQEAIERGDIETACALLDTGANIDALDRYGQTALMIAAYKGHFKLAQLLVDRGANLNHSAKSKLTALMLTVFSNQPKIARLLISSGADTALHSSYNGKTVLELAEQMERHEILELLRKAAAAPPSES